MRGLLAWSLVAGCDELAWIDDLTKSQGQRNYESCEAFVASVDACVSYEVFDSTFCDAYRDTNCKLDEYLDCAHIHSTCEDGMYVPNADTCEIPSCE